VPPWPATSPDAYPARPMKKVGDAQINLDKRIAAEISWSRTTDRKARTKPGRDAFLARFEREVDPNSVLPPHERRRRAQHALRAHMLGLAKRSALSRRRPNSERERIGPGPPSKGGAWPENRFPNQHRMPSPYGGMSTGPPAWPQSHEDPHIRGVGPVPGELVLVDLMPSTASTLVAG
jgi:hypothetical protein